MLQRAREVAIRAQISSHAGQASRLGAMLTMPGAGARKSTSGGPALRGRRAMHSWSSTRTIIGLSSGEAEYHGTVKTAAVALGLQAVLGGFGVTCELTIKSAARAAAAIAG